MLLWEEVCNIASSNKLILSVVGKTSRKSLIACCTPPITFTCGQTINPPQGWVISDLPERWKNLQILIFFTFQHSNVSAEARLGPGSITRCGPPLHAACSKQAPEIN